MIPSISFGSDEISLSGDKLFAGLPLNSFVKSDVRAHEFKDSRVFEEADLWKPAINRHHDVNTSGDSELNLEKTISEGAREIGKFNFKPTRNKLPLIPYLQLQPL